MDEKYRKNLAASRAISGDAATFFAEYQAQKLAAWLPEKINAPISILDFGCGDGLITSFVQHIFVNATTYGVDTSQEHIALAQDIYPGIHFQCVGDAASQPLPFADNTFDLIYTTEVLHHIPRKEHTRYCAELLRILKPGGTLTIFELNPLNLATVYRFKTNPLEHDAQLITPWYARRLLKQYGIVKLRFYDLFPNMLYHMRILEPYLTWFPFGALYAISVLKK
jgi:ubiquinone/menaquinone biosynthesis C-methylase UbiE